MLTLYLSLIDTQEEPSRQKETYRTPYEAQPKDRLRQCVFGGSSNTLDFLPLDRAGNLRFLPIMIYPEKAEVHILEDEDASRAYLLQVWAEAMTVYRSGHYSMKFSKSIQRQLVEVQKDFMPEEDVYKRQLQQNTASRKPFANQPADGFLPLPDMEILLPLTRCV